MKKVLLLLGIVLSLALVSCADDPFSTTGKIASGNVQITLDDNGAALTRGIVIGSSQVTNAVIRLTGPTGIVQTATWNIGGSKTFLFNADVTGTYTLGLTQTDTSNYTASTNVTCSFVAGYDYYIAITLGGAVIVNIGTNGTLPSSSSSSVSSVSSSSSSVSSSSSSTSTGTGFGVYNYNPMGVTWDTDLVFQVWNDGYNSGGCAVSNDNTTSATGTNSLQITGIAGKSWFGVSFAVNPTGTYKNMSAYTHLVFWMKSSHNVTKIGIASGASTQVWLTGAQLATYGWSANNVWHQIDIPLSAFSGISLSQIASYLMIVADGANYGTGYVWNVDSVYYY